MKLLAIMALAAAMLPAADLKSVHTVYVFPMKNGFDQYLVNRIIRDRVLQVIADPAKADAVFTDHLGPSFEDAFDDRVLELEAGTDTTHRAFSAPRGTLFLVSRSKQVVWSAYVPPKNTTPKQLERTAEKAVKRLEADLNPKAVSPS